ncbi:MAG TPA: DUF2807 domain-containing protein [Prolixibacteraceae bacterium]|jgi:hypothetical protein|nr:DUF2807 domain-containing protein [Prolixibacteraceae bacterium]
MKTKILMLTFLIGICIIATSCSLKAQQRITSRTFDVPAFEAVESHSVANIHTEKLIAQHAKINLNGVGNIGFYCTESMDVDLSGVENAIYYGNPKNKNISKSGVGKLKSGD